MTAVLLVPPTGEPVSLDEAKAWLRLDIADDDALVTALIPAARAIVEGETRRTLMTQTWRVTLDAWPIPRSGDPFLDDALIGAAIVPLHLAPVASITAMRTFSADGTPQVLDVSTWQLVGAPERACILFDTSPPAPGRDDRRNRDRRRHGLWRGHRRAAAVAPGDPDAHCALV